MKSTLLFTLLLVSFTFALNAQHEKCGTMKYWEMRKAQDPEAEKRMADLELQTQEWIKNNNDRTDPPQIIIPVVVHVLYNSLTENISTTQIQSQIVALNEDFRLLNADSLPSNHPFWPRAIDCEIEFCLASFDPIGNATTGITRTFTDSLEFAGVGNEKASATGGKDNWDPEKYLNIWVCDLASGLGYSAFPSDLGTFPDKDGIVINHHAFGYTGTAGTGGFDAANLGRTVVHEVGHWLNLRHIWGDAFCGTDFVADTPPAEGENFGCFTFPHRANNLCGSGSNGEMYMNYMDYVDDSCMVMFTLDQANRMIAAINNIRTALINSNACVPNAAIGDPDQSNPLDVRLFPNPNNGILNVQLKNVVLNDISLTIFNVFGQTIYSLYLSTYTGNGLEIDLQELSNGIYFVRIATKDQILTKKLFLKK